MQGKEEVDMEYSTNHGNFGYWGQAEGGQGGSQGHQQNHNSHPVPVSNLSSYQSSSGSVAASPMTPPAGISSNAALNYCANFLNEFQMVQQLQLQQVRQGQEMAARSYNTRELHPLDSGFGGATDPRFVLAGSSNQGIQTLHPVHLQPPMSMPVQNVSQAPHPTYQGVRSKNRKPRQQKPAPPKRKRGRPLKKKVEMDSEDDYTESDEDEDDFPANPYFRKECPSAKIKKGTPLPFSAQKNSVKETTAITTIGAGSNDAMASRNPVTSTSSEGVKRKRNCELPANCTICNKTLSSTAGLTRHLKEVHPDGQLKKPPTQRRPKVDLSFRRIPAHEMIKMTPDQEEFLKIIIDQVTCTKCTIKFRSKHKLRKHVKRHHSKNKRSESEGKVGPCEFNCQICSSTFDRRSDLAKHFWLSHYNAKRGWFSSIFSPLRCPFCPKEKLIKQLGQFNLHISSCHSEETDFSIIGAKDKNTESWRVGETDKKSNYCSQCNFVTPSSVALAEHFATIHVIPGFSFCKICGIFQADQDSRVEHSLRLHPEVEIEETNEESLLTDSILLQDVDLQLCDTCDSCFSSAKFLTQHKSADHPKIMDGVRCSEGIVDRLSCFYCGNVSKSRTRHDEHMKSAHPHLGLMYQYVKERNIYKCEYCKGYFGHVVKLRQHFYQIHMAQPPIEYNALEVAEQEISKLASELCQAVLATPTIPIRTPKPAAVPVTLAQNINQGLIPKKIQEQDADYEDPIIIRGKITRKVTFTCYICSETFHLGKELDQHQINYHPEKRDEFSLICGVCHKKYSTINIRRQHIVRTHLKILQEKLKCDQCDKYFETKLDRKKHVMIMHKEFEMFVEPPAGTKHAPVPEPLQEWTCFVCKDKFQSRNLLLVHIENAHPDNFEEGSRRVCGICNIKVSSKNVLARHVRIQHCQSWRRFSCPQCPANFPRAEGARNHFKSVHQGLNVKSSKPNCYKNQCEYCSLAFPNEIQKRRHVHTDHPEEALAERKKKTMQMTSYTSGFGGEFYCKICTFSYASESKLIQHVVSVHDRDLKPCEFCWRDVNVYNYNKHISRSHPERYYSLHTPIKNPSIPDRLRRLPLRTVLNLISKVQHEEEAAGNVNESDRLVKSVNKNKASNLNEKPDGGFSSSENSAKDSGSDSQDSDSNSDSSSPEEVRSHDNEDELGDSGSDSDESLGLGLNFASDDESKHTDKSKKPKRRSKQSRLTISLTPTSAKSSGKTRRSKPKLKITKRTNRKKLGVSKKASKSWGLDFSSNESSSDSEASISEPNHGGDSEKNIKKVVSLSQKVSSLPAKSSWENCPKMFNAVVELTILPISLTKINPSKAEATTSKIRTQKSKSLGLGLNFSSDDSSDFLLKSTEDEDINDSTDEDSFKNHFPGTNLALERSAKPDNLREVAPKKSTSGKPRKPTPNRKPQRSIVTETRTEESSSKNTADKNSSSDEDWQNFNVPKVKVEAIEVDSN